MATQQPGAQIAGYRIESMIGRGGMAVVYRAEDVRLGRKVALKVLTPQLAGSEQFRQRFIRESRLAASLDHPNIVPIYEAGEADGQLFIAMRYVVGSDLKELLAREGGRLPPSRVLGIFGQIGDALDSAHQAGLVHRDVKPGNVLVAAGQDHPRPGHGDHVYLTDFGLTKRTSELSGGLTGTGHFLGTVDFVSPEQIQGKPVGPGTDIYALGCVLYECLTGQLPFRRDDDAALLWAHLVETSPPVTGIRPELPEAVNAVVARAMAKDPADRFESCRELLHALEVALGMPTRVSSPGGPWSGDSGGGPGPAGATSDSYPAEPGTVTDDVVGEDQHPSLPSGSVMRFPAPEDSSQGTARRADHDPDLEEFRYLDPQKYPDPEEDYPEPDQYDGDGDWGEGESVTGPPAAHRRRHWKIIAAVAAIIVVLAAGTVVLLRSSLFPEDYLTYTSNETVVRFHLGHPASWSTKSSAASEIMLGPDPTAVDNLFFHEPQGWEETTATLRSKSPDDVWLYVYSSNGTYDTYNPDSLAAQISSVLPQETRIQPALREVSVAGTTAQELEGVTSDPANPQTTVQLLSDLVQPPDVNGALLLVFISPPETFQDHVSTFHKIRDSLQIIH